MIKFLPTTQLYKTNRDYLSEWYQQDTVVVTDNDLCNIDCAEINRYLEHREFIENLKILDVTHNPVRHWPLNLSVDIILTNDIDCYYSACDKVKFFPLFLWMFSAKKSLWWQHVCFDAGHEKIQKIMCFNNQPRYHRTLLRQQLLPVVDQMVYTIDRQGLPTDIKPSNSGGFNDVGVSHSVYNQCAVNLVTETTTDFAYISEKICKPFIAHQIPIIVGGARVTKFLSDIGLDMFDDLVPWQSWDNEPVVEIRVEKIARFVTDWIVNGSILKDYNRVIDRVIKNKQYFHSAEFRNKIMYQMK